MRLTRRSPWSSKKLKFMIDGMKFQIEQSGMKLEDSGFDPEQAEKEWRERAEFNTKGYLILEGIAKAENIHVAQSDMEEEYKRLAEETKKSVEEVKQSLFSNQDYMTQTSNRILGQEGPESDFIRIANSNICQKRI